MHPTLASLRRCQWSLALASVIFLGCVVMLPVGWHSPSSAGQSIAMFLGSGRGTRCIFPYAQQWYRRTPTGFEMIPDSELQNLGKSADEAQVSIDTHPSGTSGAWGVTRRFQSVRVTVWVQNGTPGEEQTLRALYVDALAAAGDPLLLAHMPSLRTQDYSSTSIIWSGWVHNLVSLASVSACVVSLRRLPGRLRAWRRAKVHHCPACDYDLRGTPGNMPCPECGAFAPQGAPVPAR